jgi:inner membrane transporter RhtA
VDVNGLRADNQPVTATRTGAGMALVSMFFVQLGIAASVGIFDQVGPEGAACLRLVFAGLILLAIVRPRPGAFSRGSLAAAIALGVVTATVTICFMAAVDRIPMGTASALEFLGPLGVAILRGRGGTKAWPAIAAIGVVLLTEPWGGALDPAGVAFALAAAFAWALYIVLTQRVGDEVAGLQGLAISMPVAGLVATVVAGPSLVGDLTLEVLLAGVGLAILLPVIPFALEMLALRRLTATAFGTLMSLEPALALLMGLVVLGQAPGLLPVAGIAFVVVAGIGAERTGGRPGPDARDRVAAVPLRQGAPSRSRPAGRRLARVISQSGLFAGGGGERGRVDPEAAHGADGGAVLHVGDREHHVRADELGVALAGEASGRLEGALRRSGAAVDAVRARRDGTRELRPGIRVNPDRAQRLGMLMRDRLPEAAWVRADPLEGPPGGAVGHVQGSEQEVLGSGH